MNDTGNQSRHKVSRDDLTPGDLQRVLFEDAADGVFITDPQGRFVAGNPRGTELTGYPREELLGLTITDLIPPEDLARDPIRLDDLRQGKTVVKERRIRRKDGSLLPVEISARMLPGGALLGLVRDITERRKAAAVSDQRGRELAALQALGLAVCASLSLEQTSVAALQGMLEAVEPDLAFLFLREGERLVLQEVRPPEARPWLGAIPEHRVGECICGLAVLEGRPIYSRDIPSDRRCTWEECKQAGIRAFAALPLRSGEELLGVLGLASVTERDFAAQTGFLETLAHQVSMALANARLYEAARRELAERQEAEEALTAHENLLGSVFRAAPIGIGVVSNRCLLAVNDRLCEMIGRASEDLIGQSARLLYPSDADFEYVGTEKYRQIAERGRGMVETRWQCKDGRVIDVQLSSAPINPMEMAGGVTFTALDITERKQTMEALRQANLVVENSPVVLFRWQASEGWPVELVSRNVSQFGYAPEALLSGAVPFAALVHPDDLERVAREVQEYSAAGADSFQQEYRIVTQDGGVRWLDDRTVVERNVDGQITAYQGIVIDITERKQAEMALRSSLEEKESLLKEVHHRVKNNLQVISSLLSLQFRQVENAELRSFLRDTQNRIRSMAMLHEILYHSENKARINFPQYVKDLCAQVARSLGTEARKIRLRQEIAPVSLNLDQAVTAGLIINELVTNAFKHAFPSRSEGEILVELQAPDEHHLLLRVSDDGIGFPPERPPQRSESLGLLLVKNLSRQLEGRLSVTGRAGTVFEILFPPNPLER